MAGNDFSYWKLGGKLDVPKERWVSFPHYEGPDLEEPLPIQRRSPPASIAGKAKTAGDFIMSCNVYL